MELSDIRLYCLSLPYVTEDMPFGDDILVLRVCEKIFACFDINDPEYLALKCDPDYAVELREKYTEIEPAYHWNKKYWNQICTRGTLRSDFIRSLIRHSYAQVVKKLPKAVKTLHPEILEIS